MGRGGGLPGPREAPVGRKVGRRLAQEGPRQETGAVGWKAQLEEEEEEGVLESGPGTTRGGVPGEEQVQGAGKVVRGLAGLPTKGIQKGV